MNEQAADELARSILSRSRIDARCVHLMRGADGWVAVAYLDDNDDAASVIVRQQDSESHFAVTELMGDGSDIASSRDELDEVLAKLQREHMEWKAGR